MHGMNQGVMDRLHRLVDVRLNYGREAVADLMRTVGSAATVLDIAAGGGFDLDNARAIFPAARLAAFDFDPGAVARLRARQIDACRLDLEREPFPQADGSVDVIIANQILEHTKDLFWIFDQMARVLAPRGHLIIGVPNLASLHNRLLLAVGRQPTPIRSASAHVRGFTRADLLDFVESCFPGGLKLLAWKGSNFYPFPAPLARPLAALLPGLAWGNFFLFRLERPYTGEFLRFPAAQQLETNFFVGPGG